MKQQGASALFVVDKDDGRVYLRVVCKQLERRITTMRMKDTRIPGA